MRLFRSLSCVVCTFILSAALADTGDDWRTYRNEEGNFSVQLPGQPKTEPAGENTFNFMLLQPGMAYLVTYNFHSESAADDTNFEAYQKGVAKSLECNVLSDGPSTRPIAGYKSHQYRYDCSQRKQIITGNLYWGTRTAYAVVVIFNVTAGSADPPNIRRFTDSFTLLDASK